MCSERLTYFCNLEQGKEKRVSFQLTLHIRVVILDGLILNPIEGIFLLELGRSLSNKLFFQALRSFYVTKSKV